MRIFKIVTPIVFLAVCGMADGAKADYTNGNPYIPGPIPVTETADHGQASYCAIGRSIPAWTCDQELSANGEVKGFAARLGKHVADPNGVRPSPPTPPSPPGPPTSGL